MIELGEVNSHFFLLLIYPIGIISARLIIIHYKSNPYYYLFLFYISHFLVLIPLLIYKIKGKKTKIKKEELRSNSTLIPNDLEIENEINILKAELNRNKTIEKISKILIIGIFYFSTYTFFYFSNFIKRTDFYGNISIISEVFYFSLFNKIILRLNIYSHHFFSMILITLSIIGLYILLMKEFIGYNKNYDIIKDFIFPSFVDFIVYFFFCFYLIKSKNYIEKYFISLYEIIGYLGLFCTILLVIFEPITFFIKCDNDIACYDGHLAGIISGFHQSLSINGLFASFGLLFSLFLTALGLWSTVKYLSPCHFLTSDSLITFGLNILLDYYKSDISLLNNPLFCVFSILTIIACFIYNEIIIIKVCNLDYNTRKNIIKRQSIDANVNNSFSDISDNSSESNKCNTNS